MAVSAHEADSTMVISLWQGDSCTGTFRLPAPEAARLIATLAYGMTDAIAGTGEGSPPEAGTPGLREVWSRFVRRLLARSPARPDSHLRLLK
jgi:hypothetical protein